MVPALVPWTSIPDTCGRQTLTEHLLLDTVRTNQTNRLCRLLAGNGEKITKTIFYFELQNSKVACGCQGGWERREC